METAIYGVIKDYMSYSLNSAKGVISGILQGSIIGVIEGDTRSLDYINGTCPHFGGFAGTAYLPAMWQQSLSQTSTWGYAESCCP